MNKTKIDWCDMTWNPVRGCLNLCPYCYARKMGTRFEGHFNPTFHPERLDELARIKKSQNIFVCSMADLFGDWVPDEWIRDVFNACIAASQHRYLFLTKNPMRYTNLMLTAPSNAWFGTTMTKYDSEYFYSDNLNTFLSIEPIQEDINIDSLFKIKWVIIGRETGNRKDKIIPKKEWIANIMNYCKEKNVPVFMKNNLKDIWLEPLVQEFPWKN